MNELDTLKARARAILETNAYWKNSQDGSYEMALHNSGYWEVLEQIKKLENRG
jgi:hypothetical protein